MESGNITQSTQPAEQVPATSETPKSGPKWLMIILATLLLISLAGNGYFAYQFFNSQLLLTSISPTPTPTSDFTIPSPTPDPTANWKVYQDKTYNYSIKYPGNEFSRIICPGDESNKFMLVTGSKIDPIQSGTCARDSFYALELTPGDKEFYEPQSSPDYNVELENITVAGVQAKKYILTQKEASPGPLWYLIVLIDRNGKNYQILYHGSCGYNPEMQRGTCENTFNQMLSTFEFTN